MSIVTIIKPTNQLLINLELKREAYCKKSKKIGEKRLRLAFDFPNLQYYSLHSLTKYLHPMTIPTMILPVDVIIEIRVAGTGSVMIEKSSMSFS